MNRFMNQVEMNQQAKLSEHFSLGELTRSKSHPEVYNIPSHVNVENLKRVCVWLEALRERYNRRYVLAGDTGGQVPKVEVFGENFISRPDPGGARPDPGFISGPDPEQCKNVKM